MYANGTNVVTTKFLVASGRVVSPDHENYINEKANSLSLSLSLVLRYLSTHVYLSLRHFLLERVAGTCASFVT